MTRVVQGLRWARKLPAKPGCIPTGRPRGAKAQGVRYERALARALPMARPGVWFEYEDAQGHGFCQVDLMLALARGIVVFEAKYTWCPEGHCQIENLYSPVVGRALGLPVVGLVVCKRLIPGMAGVTIAGDLGAALASLATGKRVAWHWLGTSAIGQDEIAALAA